MTKEIKRRKSEDRRKTTQLQFRLTAEQKSLMHQAAEQAGISVSAWAVERLLRCARSELAEMPQDGR